MNKLTLLPILGLAFAAPALAQQQTEPVASQEKVSQEKVSRPDSAPAGETGGAGSFLNLFGDPAKKDEKPVSEKVGESMSRMAESLMNPVTFATLGMGSGVALAGRAAQAARRSVGLTTQQALEAAARAQSTARRGPGGGHDPAGTPASSAGAVVVIQKAPRGAR